MVPHIVLEEIGTPYQRQLVDLARGEHKSDAYLTSWKSAGSCRR
jgi:glutathione S-transferase